MAKTKKQKVFKYYESREIADGFAEPYVCITKSMLMSEAWKSLSYSARNLYLYMKLWSYGRQEFSFSYALGVELLKSKATMYKCVNELVSNGFIEITRVSKTPNVGTRYKFIDKWYRER